jgi:hypothetical protein
MHRFNTTQSKEKDSKSEVKKHSYPSTTIEVESEYSTNGTVEENLKVRKEREEASLREAASQDEAISSGHNLAITWKTAIGDVFVFNKPTTTKESEELDKSLADYKKDFGNK